MGAARARILLVAPPSENIRRNAAYSFPSAPLGILSLATFLRKRGVAVEILDLSVRAWNAKEFGRLLLQTKPAFVGISCSEPDVRSIIELCRVAKESGIRTIIGGPEATKSPLNLLALTRADIVIPGNAESRLLEVLLGRKPLHRIGGIAFRGSRGGTVSTLKKSPENLGAPARIWKGFRERKNDSACIVASRGCPYHCTFCATPVISGTRVSTRPVRSVISEIRDISERSTTHVVMMDNIFGVRRRWLESFCKSMVASGLSRKVTWTCYQRADLVDARLLRLMKSAGCASIGYGAESGSLRILKKMRKGLTPEKVRRACELTKEAGIEVCLFFLLGYPGETAEDLAETEKLVFEAPSDHISLTLFKAFPGTPATREAKTRGLLPARAIREDNPDLYPKKGSGPLSRRALAAARSRIYLKYYLSPQRALRGLSNLFSADSLGAEIRRKLAFFSMVASRNR